MILVRIREVSSGEEIDYEDDFHDSWEDAEFQWTEGNASCDCNRELYFRRSKGEDPNWNDVECSEGRYVLVSVTERDGTVIDLLGQAGALDPAEGVEP